MLLSHTHKLIFLKTRKSASTSVEMLLEPFCRNDGGDVLERTAQRVCDAGIVGSRRDLSCADDIWWNHMSAQDVRDNLPGDIWDCYLKIATVRNPFCAVHSLYNYHTKRSTPHGFIALMLYKLRFRVWVHRRLRKEWFGDEHIVSINGQLVIDRFVHFEHLSEDLDVLIADLDLQVDATTLPRTKISKQAGIAYDMTDLYDTHTADIVRARYNWAFDGLGYSPRLEDSALPPARFQRADQSRVATPDSPARSST